MGEDLLTPRQAGEILKVSLNTLRDWRTKRVRLRFVKAGSRVYYQRQDVEAFRHRYQKLVEVDDAE